MSKESSVTHPVFKNYVDFEILMSFLKYVFFFFLQKYELPTLVYPVFFRKHFMCSSEDIRVLLLSVR